VRSATTLGIVGAGGIGQTLYESIRSFHYGDTAAQVIIVIATVMAIDLLSARPRKAPVQRPSLPDLLSLASRVRTLHRFLRDAHAVTSPKSSEFGAAHEVYVPWWKSVS
jgi:hypothetical protein